MLLYLYNSKYPFYYSSSAKILQITNTVSLITIPLVVGLSLWALKLYFDNKTVTVEAEPKLQADTAEENAQ